MSKEEVILAVKDRVRIRIYNPDRLTRSKKKRWHNKWEGNYWSDCVIETISPCGRYAKISGHISWGGHKKTLIPIEHLKKEKI